MFKCLKELFEPTVMFFELCNSSATFQAMMDDIFRDFIDEGWIIIYMDDILIFSNELLLHRQQTKQVLKHLQENDFFLKLKKCSFDISKVKFLSMIIKPNLVAMDSVKLKGIHNWPTPASVKEVRSFLGFGNFYQRFILHYSHIAKPLNDLMKKEITWHWTSTHQNAFEELKQRFAQSLVLLLPDKLKPFSIESDASQFATGAVL